MENNYEDLNQDTIDSVRNEKIQDSSSTCPSPMTSHSQIMSARKVVEQSMIDELDDKMTPFQTFAALCKGYCAINILILPKQFENGGWLIGLVSIFVAVLFVLQCALKLVKCSNQLEVYNYSEVALHALGPRGKIVVDIVLSLVQFSFTIAQITFSLQAMGGIFGEINPWIYATILIIIYAPLAWVRKLQYFSFGYIFGNVMILFTVIVISGYCITLLAKDGPKTDAFVPVNTTSLWYMIGFSFYCFEGIGVVLPIMDQSKDKKNFSKILTAALLTLATIFSAFGFLCYKYFGH